MLNFSAIAETPSYSRKRLKLGALLLLVIILGLGSRRFGNALPEFIASNAGDALWTIAVYLSLAITFPKTTPWKLGLTAYTISIAVEFSQLIDVNWLNDIRKTLPGKLLLGAGFVPVDLLRYLVGAAVAFSVDRLTWWRSSVNAS